MGCSSSSSRSRRRWKCLSHTTNFKPVSQPAWSDCQRKQFDKYLFIIIIVRATLCSIQAPDFRKADGLDEATRENKRTRWVFRARGFVTPLIFHSLDGVCQSTNHHCSRFAFKHTLRALEILFVWISPNSTLFCVCCTRIMSLNEKLNGRA